MFPLFLEGLFRETPAELGPASRGELFVHLTTERPQEAQDWAAAGRNAHSLHEGAPRPKPPPFCPLCSTQSCSACRPRWMRRPLMGRLAHPFWLQAPPPFACPATGASAGRGRTRPRRRGGSTSARSMWPRLWSPQWHPRSGGTEVKRSSSYSPLLHLHPPSGRSTRKLGRKSRTIFQRVYPMEPSEPQNYQRLLCRRSRRFR